mgnify:CR=1 FL=1
MCVFIAKKGELAMEGWKYYNHALIPTTAPHVTPNTYEIYNGNIWRKKWEGLPLFARWTSNFDCGYETNWWYVIKDAPYVFDELSSGQRKDIRRAFKKCYVIKINALDYVEDILRVHKEAILRYKKWNQKINEETFKENIRKNSSNFDYWGAFSLNNNQLIGYMMVSIVDQDCVELNVAKFSSIHLKTQMSDAMYHTVLNYYLNEKQYKYISSGQRSINHVTNTEDYIIQRFKYRRAYCTLNIEYNPRIVRIIKIIYPFRKLLKMLDNINIIHKVNAVLLMEEIKRKQHE